PKFRMGLDLMSVISGDKMKIKSVFLSQPNLKFKVLKSGKANWDIYKTQPETPGKPVDTTASNFKIGIKKWEIEDGKLVYEDLSIPFMMKALHVDHTGSGDFEKNIFDMVSHTTSQ